MLKNMNLNKGPGKRRISIHYLRDSEDSNKDANNAYSELE